MRGANDSRGEWAELSRMAWPASCAAALFASMDIVNAAMLGLVGVQEMAGGGFGASIVFSVVAFPAGMVTVLTPLAAGEGAELRSGPMQQMKRLALRSSLAMGLLGSLLLLGIYALLPLLGLERGLTAVTRQYLLWRLPVIALEVLFVAAWSLLEGLGRTRAAFLAGAAAVGTELLLNLTLIPGRWVIPRLGVVGAALAADISVGVGLCVVLGMLLRRPSPSRAGEPVASRGAAPEAGARHATLGLPSGLTRRFLHKGWPLGATAVLGLVDWLLLSMMVARLGTQAAAGNDLLNKMIQLGMALAQGIGAAALVLVARTAGGRRMAAAAGGSSRRVGAQDRAAARQHVRRAIILQLLLAVLLGVAVGSFGEEWLRLFTSDRTVLSAGGLLLPFAAAIIGAEGLSLVLTSIVEGLYLTRLVLKATFYFDLLFGVAAVFVLGSIFGLQGFYIAWAMKMVVKIAYLAHRLARELADDPGQAGLPALLGTLLPDPRPLLALDGAGCWSPFLRAGAVPYPGASRMLCGRSPVPRPVRHDSWRPGWVRSAHAPDTSESRHADLPGEPSWRRRAAWLPRRLLPPPDG